MPAHSISDWDFREVLGQVATRPSSELESETLEFKGYTTEQALHNSGDLPEELSALANNQGGVIIVGVKSENAVPFGNWEQQLAGWDGIPDETAIRERLRGRLRPVNVELRVTTRQFRERYYVVIGIAHPQDTLVSTSGGKFYIRDGRSSRPMTPDELQAAVKNLRTYDWSADAVGIAALEALDRTAMEEAHREFCESRGIGPDLDRMKFLEAIGATHHGELLRGGLMFLGREEVIRAELGNHEYRFLWKTKVGELKINDVWSGCIWNAVRRAKNHFESCNQVQTFQYKGKEFQAPLLDPIAFHEAYLNALVHRDYAGVGMVSVLFTGDRMTITSPGGFYGGVTAENIAVHEPRHRNQTLAKLLMTFHMVDRAGAGVLRMGLGSLRYGRSFPKFVEAQGTVEVSMEAQYIKPPISVLALNNSETYGIAELLILNMVVDQGVTAIGQVLNGLSKLLLDPWKSAQEAIENLRGVVELCGTQSGIFIRVAPKWKGFMGVEREFIPSRNSGKHVLLYQYLKKHGEASNANLRAVLKHASPSQTSSFLRHAKYVQRTGSGPSARWSLVE